MRLKVDAWKLRAFLAVVILTIFLAPASLVHSQLAERDAGWRSFFFYSVIIENCLYVSTFSYVSCYVIAVSFYIVLPLLRMTVREFEDASRTMDVSRLDVSFGKAYSTPWEIQMGVGDCHPSVCRWRFVATSPAVASLCALTGSPAIFSALRWFSWCPRSPLLSPV